MTSPRVARFDVVPTPGPDVEPVDLDEPAVDENGPAVVASFGAPADGGGPARERDGSGAAGPDPVGPGAAGTGAAGPGVGVFGDAAPVAELGDLGSEVRDPAEVADLGAVDTAAGGVAQVAQLGRKPPGREPRDRELRDRESRTREPRDRASRVRESRDRVAASEPAVRPGSGSRGPGSPPDDRRLRPARDLPVAHRSAEEPTAESAEARPARPRRPPGPKQIDPDSDPVLAAREICLRLLTDRARTRKELAQALARRGVPDDAAHTVLDRFDEVGLIDDAAFAGQWVRSRHRHRGLARRAIAQELRRKGVDDETAGEALAEVDEGSEARRARELVDRKLRTMPADSPEQRTVAARKLVGMLARKGYGAGTAYGVVREALAAHGAEIDELDGADVPDD